MKKIALLLLFYLSVNASQAQSQKKLEVVIKNIRDDKGVLIVGIFNSESTFIKKAWRGQKPKPQQGTVHVIFEDIPAGEYAISVIHDNNENGKLDSNFMGIPKEGVGFSNDAVGTFGPPSYDKSRFNCPMDQAVSVTMKYY